MAEDLEHVLRPSFPWRSDVLTECGLEAARFDTISRQEFADKLKKQGQQRSAMTTCMTCWQTATRHHDWTHSPAHVMAREVNVWGDEKKSQINAELRAIAALIAAHEDEFRGYLEGLEHTSSLDEARRRARIRAAREGRRG